MYKVARDNGVEVGCMNWHDYGDLAFVKINLAKGCVVYFYYPLVEMCKLTGDDIADLIEVENVADLLQFISSQQRQNAVSSTHHQVATQTARNVYAATFGQNPDLFFISFLFPHRHYSAANATRLLSFFKNRGRRTQTSRRHLNRQNSTSLNPHGKRGRVGRGRRVMDRGRVGRR